jgi:phytoene desaturase
MNKRAIVIGGGFAGLSAAGFLARSGMDVTVLEKNDRWGGRAGKLEALGFKFDMGPTWYWMPEVFEKFFNSFGHQVSDFYDLKRLDPGYRMYFDRDDYVDVPADYDELLALFDRIEPGSAVKLDKFLKEAAYKYDIGLNRVVHKPGHSFMEFLDPGLMAGAARLDFFRSISTVVRRLFHDERLIRILEFPVIFLGAAPSKTPALYSLMNYADLKLGTWYPMGGMYSVVEAMVKVAKEQGARLILNSPVDQLLVGKGKITGINVNGSTLRADVVVAAADYHHVEQQLLPVESHQYSRKYWSKRVMAPSALLFYIGVNKKINNLEHHNLFFDTDFEIHAGEIYDHPQWPANPAIYVSCSSKTDATVSPEGHENLIVLIPVAPGLKDSEEIREHYYNLVIRRIEYITGEKIEENIVFHQAYAHNDFINDYNSYRGNAYGLANTLMQTAFLKPKMRSPRVSNLYYAGQLTTPGPGVPPSIISGEVAAGEVLKQFKN